MTELGKNDPKSALNASDRATSLRASMRNEAGNSGNFNHSGSFKKNKNEPEYFAFLDHTG